ncbi:MAG: hypothetical protein NTZ12_07820 [Candidatus Aminicenantes bacterium]|nr:hypothetical protein [Candidatus Aminicenantes bacterium]
MKNVKRQPWTTEEKNGKKRRSVLRLGRVVNKSMGFQQAREWEILQEITMTPEQRQRAAKALKERFYGKKALDVRASHLNR